MNLQWIIILFEIEVKFSMAVGGRFINSNLKVASDANDATAARYFAVDVAGFFSIREIAYSDF
jgi:hypothetical protein